MNSKTVDLLIDLDYDGLKDGKYTKSDGSPLTTEEIALVNAAEVGDLDMANDTLKLRVALGQLQTSAASLMVQVLKANGMTEGGVTSDVFPRMSDEHKRIFTTLAPIALGEV